MKNKKDLLLIKNTVKSSGDFSSVLKKVDFVDSELNSQKKKSDRQWPYVFVSLGTLIVSLLLVVILMKPVSKSKDISDVTTRDVPHGGTDLYKKITSISFNGIDYKIDLNSQYIVNKTDVQDKVGNIVVNYVDDLTGEVIFVKVDIYSINGLDKNQSLAFMFENDLNYYLYSSK